MLRVADNSLLLTDFQIENQMKKEDEMMGTLTKIVGKNRKKQKIRKFKSLYLDMLPREEST